MATYQEVVREYFPGASDKHAEAILWGHTSFPGFWGKKASGTVEEILRKQLQELKDKVEGGE